MQTLDSPVYEVKQDSQWYKDTIETREKRAEFFETLNKDYFQDNGFAFYHDEYFGVYGSSRDYETYKDELKKNPDKNGIYIFKKRSKHYQVFSEMLKEVEKKDDPFKRMDVFGLNNTKASQWINGRWFWQVKDLSQVKGDEVEPIDYKDYLKICMEQIDKEKANV